MSVESAPDRCAKNEHGRQIYVQTHVLVRNAGDFPGARRVLGTQSPGSDDATNSHDDNNPNAAAENNANNPGGSFGNLHGDVC